MMSTAVRGPPPRSTDIIFRSVGHGLRSRRVVPGRIARRTGGVHAVVGRFLGPRPRRTISSMARSRRSRQHEKPGDRQDDTLVAVVVDSSLPYDRAIAMGVAEYARERGDWRLYVEEEQGRRLPDFQDWPGRGIIASFDDAEVARSVVASGLPVVAVGGGGGSFSHGSAIPYVATDDAQVARLAAEHLLERALEHFGFYGLPPSPTTVWSDVRCRAFVDCIAAAGRSCQPLIARHEATRWTLLQAEIAAWLAALPKPVGIMACDDVRARHVLEVCRGLRLRVPHDVAVIGVDDDEFVCELSDPPLSSVAQAARRVGYEAARLLDRLLRPGRAGRRTTGRAARPPRLVIPPIGVVARRSTDTLAVHDPVVANTIRSIRERASRGLAIADLVGESGLSRWQLEERFRRAVGRSLHDDILHVRLGEARRLVTTTDLPLKAVAPRAGLSSITYMTTLFRRHFGMTPAAMRAASRGRESP
jgi:LacI family transcriptional regulator